MNLKSTFFCLKPFPILIRKVIKSFYCESIANRLRIISIKIDALGKKIIHKTAFGGTVTGLAFASVSIS